MVEYASKGKKSFYSGKEISKKFNGKWVYITNAKFTKSNGLIEGVVVLTADFPYEDADKGIYEEFEDESKYGEVFAYDFRSVSSRYMGR